MTNTKQLSVQSEIERIRFSGSVPTDYESARRYAGRLEARHYADLRKMQSAAVRLNVLAEACADADLKRDLAEVGLSLL